MDIHEGLSLHCECGRIKRLVVRVEATASESGKLAATDSQQLKAEIAALIPGIVTSFTLYDEKQFIALINELRQLSAV